MLEIKTLHQFDTEYSADSVEWCHVDDNKFVVGTYQLEEKDKSSSANNTRKGRIYLFQLDQELDLTKIQQIETDAILDQKWKGDKLLAATSTGFINSYQLGEDGILSEVGQISINQEDEKSLALSIDIWDDTSTVLASDSLGRISLIDLKAGSVTQQLKAHGFEAWTCAFDRFNQNIVFSGGDDASFQIWDLRTDENPSKIRSTTRDAGVTSFLNIKENFLLVGSYDENLSLYDTRNIKRSVDELNLGGGIWRIKQSHSVPNCVIVAAMYHNFSIVDFTNELKLTGTYHGHDSICYGVDWSPKSFKDGHIFASCSFYDKKLSVCEVNFDNKN